MEHTSNIDIIGLIANASLVVQIVMAILLLLSLLGWFIIFRLMGRFASASRADANFEHTFWSGASLKVLYQHAVNGKAQHLEGVFADSFSEHLKTLKAQDASKLAVKTDTSAVTRGFRVSMQRKQGELEHGISTLASIGSVSPYIGLFGTVWGIMNAFIGLSQASQANLASVAPGIAEALIATAMGLFAAIPAVLAYNHFTAKAEKIYSSRALFGEELVGLLERDTKPVQMS